MAYKRIVILLALFAFFIGIAFATDYNEKRKQDSKMMGIKKALMPLDKELSIIKKLTREIPLQLKQIEKILKVELIKSAYQPDLNYITYSNSGSEYFGEIEATLSKTGKKGLIKIEFINPLGLTQLIQVFGKKYRIVMARPQTSPPKNYIKEIFVFDTNKFRASATTPISDDPKTRVIIDWTK